MLYIRLKALQAETARTTANLRSEQAFEGEKIWANKYMVGLVAIKREGQLLTWKLSGPKPEFFRDFGEVPLLNHHNLG